MAHEQGTARDASSVPHGRLEVLEVALRLALTGALLRLSGSYSGDKSLVEELGVPEIARELLDHLDVQGFTLVTCELLEVAKDAEERLTRRDERRVCAALLDKARMDAVTEYREREEKAGPGELEEDEYLVVQAMHLDALAVRLARGER